MKIEIVFETEIDDFEYMDDSEKWHFENDIRCTIEEHIGITIQSLEINEKD